MKKKISIIFFLASVVFLIPGLLLPVMTIKITADRQEMAGIAVNSLFPPEKTNPFIQNILHAFIGQQKYEGNIEIFEKTRSILETMNDLISNGHVVVGILIGFFAVIIPVSKILIVIFSVVQNSPKEKIRFLKINSLMSKWSMSDVFVMAIMVSYLAVNANESASKAVQISSYLNSGFYFFAVYCILAITAGQLMHQAWSSQEEE